MRQRVATLAATLMAALSLGAPGRAQGKFALQPAPALSSAGAPAALAALLDAQGSRLVRTDAGNAPVCDVWWVKSVPAVAPTDTSPDILFNNLAVGTLVGVVESDSPDFADARGQKLKPGLYTLRYAQIPQDGNHMGVSDYRDFLLLSPVSADTAWDKALSFDDLVNASRKAAGTGHPAVLSMAPGSGGAQAPALAADDQGNTVLHAVWHEKGGSGAADTPVGVTLISTPKTAP